MRGAPHNGSSLFICRISSRSSRLALGLPGPPRDLSRAGSRHRKSRTAGKLSAHLVAEEAYLTSRFCGFQKTIRLVHSQAQSGAERRSRPMRLVQRGSLEPPTSSSTVVIKSLICCLAIASAFIKVHASFPKLARHASHTRCDQEVCFWPVEFALSKTMVGAQPE